MSQGTRLSRFVAGAVACSALTLSVAAEEARENVLLSVRDLVREAKLGDPGSITWNEVDGPVSIASPDNRFVAVVVRWGDPDRGTNNARLLIYDRADLLKQSASRVLASFSTTGRYQPISLVMWSANSESLVFAGTAGAQRSQVYRVEIGSAKMTQLTHEDRQILWYGTTPQIDRVVVALQNETHSPDSDPGCIRMGCLVTATRLGDAQRGVAELPSPFISYNLSDGRRQAAKDPPDVDNIEYCKDDLKGGLSPDGRFGLRVCRLKPYRWPHWWGEYTWSKGISAQVRQGHGGYLRQLVLIDFEQGTASTLMESPVLYSNVLIPRNPVWLQGGRELVLTGASEPLSGVGANERAARAARFSILSINPVSRQVHRIAMLPRKTARITAVDWSEASRILRVQGEDSQGHRVPTDCYRNSAGHWDRVPGCLQPEDEHGAAAPEDGVEVIAEQSLTRRPVLMAVDRRTGARKKLLDPNTWLDRRKLGDVRAVSWKSKGGRTWQGGLYYPVDYASGTRYPVVLQTHGFDRSRFSLYGVSRNFAAQAFAAQGMMVLQISEAAADGPLGAQEWPVVQEGYEAAIDYLDNLGLIDRNRVGIIGWSRSGAYVGYTLTHSSYPIAAAALTDAGDIGWWTYLAGGVREMDSSYGAPPFGNGFDIWRKLAPTFNLDKVRAPVVMWAADSLAYCWDWYAGLRMLGSPVEYWYFPDGTHEALAVNQRIFSNQLLLDWFSFWLKGESDRNAAKTGQYSRWQVMRHELEVRGAPSRAREHGSDIASTR